MRAPRRRDAAFPLSAQLTGSIGGGDARLGRPREPALPLDCNPRRGRCRRPARFDSEAGLPPALEPGAGSARRLRVRRLSGRKPGAQQKRATAMFLTSNVIVQAALLVAGLVWCRQMLARWRADLEEFRTTADLPARVGIVLPWLATGVIAVLIVRFVLEIAGRFGGGG